jgi:hypothetical protein
VVEKKKIFNNDVTLARQGTDYLIPANPPTRQLNQRLRRKMEKFI